MNTKKIFKLLLLIFLFAIASVQLSYGQKTVESDQPQRGGGEAMSSTKSRGEDPEIKQAKPETNVKNKKAEGFVQPIEKGAKPRGDYDYCTVIVDNHTDWWLDVYVDGYYKGAVSPWGDGGVNVGAGDTNVYVVAEFNDGSRITWGPLTQSCYDNFDLSIYDGSYTYESR